MVSFRGEFAKVMRDTYEDHTERLKACSPGVIISSRMSFGMSGLLFFVARTWGFQLET